MRKWYNVIVILMFVIGFALIAGSVIYYIWAVERIGDIAASGEEPLQGLSNRNDDDFRTRSRLPSEAEPPKQAEKDNGSNDDFSASDLK